MTNFLWGPPGTIVNSLGYVPQSIREDQTPFHETTEGIAQKQAYIEKTAIVDNPSPQPSASPTSTKVNQVPSFPGALNIQPASQPKNNAGLTQANFISDWWNQGGLGDLFGFLGDITSWGNFQSPIAIPQMDFWNNPLFGQTLESFNPFPSTTEAMGNWDLGGLFEMGSFGDMFGDLSGSNLNFGDLSMDFSTMFGGLNIQPTPQSIATPFAGSEQTFGSITTGEGLIPTLDGVPYTSPQLKEVEPGVWQPKSGGISA